MKFTPYRSKRLFNPDSEVPHRISRSKIDLFLECPRCFYMDQRLGIGRPSSFPLTLNIAVDELLKKEFDILRESGESHRIMREYHIDAVPLKHKDLEVWRDALRRGIEYLHPKTNLSIRGGIDDIWEGKGGELFIVDYKAKATREEITLKGDLGDQYKRQAEVYQWLFRQNGFKVSPTAYFVFVNANKDLEKFDDKLEFKMSIVPCEGDTSWIEPTVLKIKEALLQDTLPNADDECDYCTYRKSAAEAAQKEKSIPTTEHERESTKHSSANVQRKKKADEKETKNESLF